LAKAQEHVECEVSYAVPADKLEPLMRTIWPNNATINLGRHGAYVEHAKLRRAVHFFSPKTTQSKKYRLRFTDRGGKWRLNSEVKTFKNGKSLEQILTKTSKPDEITQVLREFGPVSGALAKEKLTLDFFAQTKKGNARFILAVDCMVLISPSDVANHRAREYSFEAESDREEDLNLFLESDYFRTAVRPLLTEFSAGESRWQLAADVSKGEVRTFEDHDAALSFIAKAIRLLDNPAES
jgi:hypothetical protein